MLKNKIFIFAMLSSILYSANYNYDIYMHGKYMNTDIDDIIVGFKKKIDNYGLEIGLHQRKTDKDNYGFYSLKAELSNHLPFEKMKARLNYIFTNYKLNDLKTHYTSYYLSKYNFNNYFYSEVGSYFTYSRINNRNTHTYGIIPYISYIGNLKKSVIYTNILKIYLGNVLKYNCNLKTNENCNVENADEKIKGIKFKGIEYTGIINISNSFIINYDILLSGRLNYLDKYISNNVFYNIPIYDKLKQSYNFTVYKKISNKLLFFIKNNNYKYENSMTHEYGIGLLVKY